MQVASIEHPGSVWRVGEDRGRLAERRMTSIISASWVHLAPVAEAGALSVFRRVPAGGQGIRLQCVRTGKYVLAVEGRRDRWTAEGYALVAVGNGTLGSEVFQLDGSFLKTVHGGHINSRGKANPVRWHDNSMGPAGKIGTARWELRPAPAEQVAAARLTVDSPSLRKASVPTADAGCSDDSCRARIAIGIAVTSKGTTMAEVAHSPLFTLALPTLAEHTDFADPRFAFTLFLGFDVGDGVYDKQRDRVRAEAAKYLPASHVAVEMVAYSGGKAGAPSHAVSNAMTAAYEQGYDYFYQINDDTRIKTPGWAQALTRALRNSPLGVNVGVTGPRDETNIDILTHAFVGRPHFAIIGRLFDERFINWYSDTWLTELYQPDGAHAACGVDIKHETSYKKKTGMAERYVVDRAAHGDLAARVKAGRQKVDAWLKRHGGDVLRPEHADPIQVELCKHLAT